MRAQDYDLVHTHAPVASVLGRVATTFDEQFVFARLENCYRELGVSFA